MKNADAKKNQIDRNPCDGCGRIFDARLLDAVMLDEHNASDEAYCEKCFPAHVVVAGDIWRPLGKVK